MQIKHQKNTGRQFKESLKNSLKRVKVVSTTD